MSERACRSCRGGPLVPVLSLGEQPLANALQATPTASMQLSPYPLDLVFCRQCGLVQLTVSIPPGELFTDYNYFTSYSPTVVASARNLVEQIATDRDLGPRHLAMEIASNDGYLLQHYLARGVPVLGIEPARNVAAVAEERGVSTICEFFGEDLGRELREAGYRADILHAHNVMAHVPQPNDVVSGMAQILSDDGAVVIETPYVRDLIERLEFDTIYHEHLFYYSLTSLRALLERNGLTVVDARRIALHGGSLRVTATLGPSGPPNQPVTHLLEEERRIGLHRASYYQDFAGRVADLCGQLRDLLSDLRGRGERLAGYGAAAKATVLLHTLGIGPETIPYVADQSPHKQDRFLPGTGIPVVPPARLLEDQPDNVLLFAWNFAEEVLEQQADYRERGGRFIIPIPEPALV